MGAYVDEITGDEESRRAFPKTSSSYFATPGGHGGPRDGERWQAPGRSANHRVHGDAGDVHAELREARQRGGGELRRRDWADYSAAASANVGLQRKPGGCCTRRRWASGCRRRAVTVGADRPPPLVLLRHRSRRWPVGRRRVLAARPARRSRARTSATTARTRCTSRVTTSASAVWDEKVTVRVSVDPFNMVARSTKEEGTGGGAGFFVSAVAITVALEEERSRHRFESSSRGGRAADRTSRSTTNAFVAGRDSSSARRMTRTGGAT